MVFLTGAIKEVNNGQEKEERAEEEEGKKGGKKGGKK